MHELVLSAPEALADALGDALLADDDDAVLAVSASDADADGGDERALFGEPGLPPPAAAWKRNLLTLLVADEDAATRLAAALLARHADEGLALVALRPVADDDWVRRTQSQFAPVAVTPSFWIVPTWHAPPPEARQVLRLDPGLAFGTGTHPTTRMCLRWIARRAASAAGFAGAVLDYGCGSGILAMAAALHGARRVVAVDIDEAAVAATRANAAANGLVLDVVGLPEAAGEPRAAYDWVLANILATPLTLLAPLLCGHRAPGGALVLAGILSRQAEAMQAAYAPHAALEVADEDDGWVLMTAG